MMRMAHPAFDLTYFLYVNTDREFREKNMDRCLRTYYGIFSKYLKVRY